MIQNNINYHFENINYKQKLNNQMIASIELLKILQQGNAPKHFYDSIMKWFLNFKDTIMDNKMPNRETVMKLLNKKYCLQNMLELGDIKIDIS